MRDFCFCTDGVRGHLTVAAKGIPGDLYVYGQGKNITMKDWSQMILVIGREQGYWGEREIVTTPLRVRPGASEVMALRVGYEKLHRETGWEPLVSWEAGIAETIAWYAENRDRWIGRVDWLETGGTHGSPGGPLLRSSRVPTVARATRRRDAAPPAEQQHRARRENP